MAGCGDIWVTAAFRTVRDKEYYYFMKKEYILYQAVPATQKDEKILRGPTKLVDDFPALQCTIFDDIGVTGAFPSNTAGNAFIFAADRVAEIKYDLDGGKGKVVKAPMLIIQMFPFLKGTTFEHGIDAAFETDNPCEVYIFKGNQCARINYGGSTPKVIENGLIKDIFSDLGGTIFETGLEAAHRLYQVNNQAWIFKGDSYARFQFTPGSTNNVLIWGPVKIKDPTGRPLLGKLLPRKRTNVNAN